MNLKFCSCHHCTLADNVKGLIRRVGAPFPAHLGTALAEAFKKEEDKASCRLLRAVENGSIVELAVLTLDQDAKTRAWQKGLKQLFGKMKELKAEEPVLLVSGQYSDTEWIQMAKTLMLADDSFNRFKSSGISNDLNKKDEDSFAVKAWTLCTENEVSEAVREEALLLAESVLKARELVNLPANCMTPVMLAEEAERLGKACGFEVEVFGPKAICEKKMEAYWSVAKGSDEEPRLIVMRYHNNPSSDKVLALVGKGLTYDSGGYAIKPADGMVTMFTDMGGSAAVISAISALARKKAKVNVTAIVAACENMISGHAFRNGDIIGSLAGKNIEIVNTDAEGRLTLADAVCYAWKEEKASAIIDIATLTGACGVALGNRTTAVVADCDGLYASAEKASAICGDSIWRLPCNEEFEELNKSERADIKNSGGRMAGTVSAGLFVRAFAGGKPWMHFDIAYTAYHSAADDRDPKGATGVGCELLYYIAQDYFKA